MIIQNRKNFLKLKKVSQFFNIFQLTKNQEIYLSPTHTARFFYPEFAEIYLNDRTSTIHIYLSQENINFQPSHLNIPIFPPEKKLIQVYSTIVEYYGSSIDMIIYDRGFISESTGICMIENFRFFDTSFEIEHAARNIKFKLSQGGSFHYLFDINRMMLYYTVFIKYLIFKNQMNDISVREKIITIIFGYLHTEYQESIQGIGGNIGKGVMRGRARILDRDRLNYQCPWYNNFDQGDIIIAHNTHVSYMKYIFQCGGIITENQNLLSHASLISRELGIPLVLGVKDIFLRIFDGDLIEMNSNTGEVKVLQRFWE